MLLRFDGSGRPRRSCGDSRLKSFIIGKYCVVEVEFGDCLGGGSNGVEYGV